MKRSSIKIKTTGECKVCGNDFKLSKTTDKYCSYSCYNQGEKNTLERTFKKNIGAKRKPIARKSKKQAALDSKYSKLRKAYFTDTRNKVCAVYKDRPATDVHHKMGRQGFADEIARKKDIPLLLDTRYWLAVSREAHRKIEENPVWAKEMGFSLDRLK